MSSESFVQQAAKDGSLTKEQDFLSLLRNHPFFEGLNSAYLVILADCGEFIHYKSGENIFRQGDPSSKFYAILRGKAILQMPTVGRGQMSIEGLGDGTILGWSWLLPPYKKQFDAYALEDTDCIAIDGACIREKCEADPTFGYELLKRFAAVMGERLQATRRKLLDSQGER